MLKNDALVVKIGVDTAENEPPQNWGKMNLISIPSLIVSKILSRHEQNVNHFTKGVLVENKRARLGNEYGFA